MGKLFEGKVVVVTGGGQGIGRAEAIYFAREGARVVVNDPGVARDGTGGSAGLAASVVAAIKEAGGEAVANTASVATLDGAEEIIWAALGKYGRADVLVNNAGILRDRSLLNMTERDFDDVIAVHLRGAFLTTRAFARALKVRRGTGDDAPAAIVNTTSLAGLLGNFGQANYSAGKAGIYGLTRTSSLELARLGCRVNAIAPIAKTRMTEDVPALASLGADTMGPEHVAPVVAWLASPLSGELSGRVIGVHGASVFEYHMAQTAMVEAPGGTWTPEDLDKAAASFLVAH